MIYTENTDYYLNNLLAKTLNLCYTSYMRKTWKNSQFSRDSFVFEYADVEDAILAYSGRRFKVVDFIESNGSKGSQIFVNAWFIKMVISTFPDLYKKYKLLLTD